MNELYFDETTAMMVDGNALAGMLHEMFSVEMTVAPIECAGCGNTGAIGSLKVYSQSPGWVVRCPICHNIVIRIVKTPGHFYLDARGAVFLSIPREESL